MSPIVDFFLFFNVRNINCLLHGPQWGSSPKPGHVSQLGIELVTFWFMVQRTTTEPHKLGYRLLRQKWVISIYHDYSPYKKDATRDLLYGHLVHLKHDLNKFSDIYEAQLSQVILSIPKF